MFSIKWVIIKQVPFENREYFLKRDFKVNSNEEPSITSNLDEIKGKGNENTSHILLPLLNFN